MNDNKVLVVTKRSYLECRVRTNVTGICSAWMLCPIVIHS
jgi:hypothetical protein